jgi:hypothetical protein
MNKFRLIAFVLVISMLLSAAGIGLAQGFTQVTIMQIQGDGRIFAL